MEPQWRNVRQRNGSLEGHKSARRVLLGRGRLGHVQHNFNSKTPTMHIKQGEPLSAASENVLSPSPDVPETTTSNPGEVHQSAAPPQNAPETQTPVVDQDRSELLTRARSFLTSPQVQNQDAFAKYTFLAEKGLNDNEIKSLLRTLVCVYRFRV